eukprot:7172353-Alexandrium_andersonii.AAC.1
MNEEALFLGQSRDGDDMTCKLTRAPMHIQDCLTARFAPRRAGSMESLRATVRRLARPTSTFGLSGAAQSCQG